MKRYGNSLALAVLLLAALVCFSIGPPGIAQASFVFSHNEDASYASLMPADHELVDTDGLGAYALYATGLTSLLPPEVNIDAVDLLSGDRMVFSLSEDTKIGGTVYADEDLLLWDGATISLFWDGSGNGLPAGVNLDAVDVISESPLEFSFSLEEDTRLPGVGMVADEDMARFVFGSGFVPSLDFDGSLEGLPSEVDLNAFSRDSDTVWILSFNAATRITSTLYDDSDLIAFDSAGGTFSLYFDSSAQSIPEQVEIDAMALPTATPTPTPTPSPTPWQIVFDFIPDTEDWTTGGAPVAFSEPDFVWAPDYLKMTSSTNTNTFGFWQSPQDAISADADYLYRARFTVSTDITDQSLVPQIRLRANSLNLQQYDVLSIESAGDGGASPAVLGTDYDLYFVPPANDTAAMLAFDLLNFNPSDAAVAELSLDTVTVDRFALDSLPTPTVVQDYTFDTSADGWTTGGAPIAFTSPQYIHSAGALELRATTNTNTFGLWGTHPADITIDANKLYRGTFEVRTNVTNPVLVPEMRLRYNTGNFQASHTFGISSAGDGANSPGTTNTTYDRLYFLPPANCVGEDLLVSFDILHFNPGDAPTASLILDRAIIETLSPPGLP